MAVAGAQPPRPRVLSTGKKPETDVVSTWPSSSARRPCEKVIVPSLKASSPERPGGLLHGHTTIAYT